MQKIDIVIAWVDGNDDVLRKKRHRYAHNVDAVDAAIETRFASNDEIYYNIASILKYVPFCRHILIITDHQQPAYLHEFFDQKLCGIDKIRIVDHREIFEGYEQYLPTFNSLSIESMFWNIKGLSDYFIYLNDDFFFNAPAKMEDFIESDKLVIHGHWRPCFRYKIKFMVRKFLNRYLNKKIKSGYTMGQMLGANKLGFKNFFEVHHYPHGVDRQMLSNYFLNHLDLLDAQIKYKFRHMTQLNPVSLMNHLKIQKKEAVLKSDAKLAYLKNQKNLKDFLQDLDTKDVKYGCIQSLDQLNSDQIQQIKMAMMDKFEHYLPQSVIHK